MLYTLLNIEKISSDKKIIITDDLKIIVDNNSESLEYLNGKEITLKI